MSSLVVLTNIDLNKLRIAATVFREGSAALAAERLRVTPSAISQSLKQVEKELGFRLFQRISKRLLPTEEAKHLFPLYERFLSELQGCVDTSIQGSQEIRGTLKIGAPPEFGSRQVMEVASRFAAFPNARIELRFGLPDDLAKSVLDQELDFAFCDEGPYLKKYAKTLVSSVVFEEEASLVASRSFYKTRVGGKHSFAHLSTLPHCDYRPDRKVLDLWYRHHFKRTPATVELRVSAAHVGAMIQAALRGIGLAFIPVHLIEQELKRGKLIRIPTRRPAYVNPILLLQKADKVPTKFEREFLKQFVQ